MNWYCNKVTAWSNCSSWKVQVICGMMDKAATVDTYVGILHLLHHMHHQKLKQPCLLTHHKWFGASFGHDLLCISHYWNDFLNKCIIYLLYLLLSFCVLFFAVQCRVRPGSMEYTLLPHLGIVCNSDHVSVTTSNPVRLILYQQNDIISSFTNLAFKCEASLTIWGFWSY